MLALFSKFVVLGSGAGALQSWRDDDLMALLLVLFLGVALGMCIVGLLMVLHFLRVGHLDAHRKERSRSEIQPPEPVDFGPNPPSRWLAVRHMPPQLVQQALGLHNPTLCSWEEGISAVRERKLFISPPIAEWVLVFGFSLPDPAEDVDKCFRFLLDLSDKLGEVQFFSVNRHLRHHAWARVENGRVHRAYAWAGKTLWNQGKMTGDEMELGLRCFDYATVVRPSQFGQTDPVQRNSERLSLLAARWSMDPAAINPRLLGAAPGIVGELSRSKIH